MLANRLVMGNLKGEGPARLVAAAAKEGLARAKFLMPLWSKNAGQLAPVDVNSPTEAACSSIGLNWPLGSPWTAGRISC